MSKGKHQDERTPSVKGGQRTKFIVVGEKLERVFSTPKGAKHWDGETLPEIVSCNFPHY